MTIMKISRLVNRQVTYPRRGGTSALGSWRALFSAGIAADVKAGPICSSTLAAKRRTSASGSLSGNSASSIIMDFLVGGWNVGTTGSPATAPGQHPEEGRGPATASVSQVGREGLKSGVVAATYHGASGMSRARKATDDCRIDAGVLREWRRHPALFTSFSTYARLRSVGIVANIPLVLLYFL